MFIENTGTAKQAKWQLKDKTYYQIDVGSNSAPYLLDIDQDGDLDLLIGNYAGRVILYLNKGSKKKPLFVLESTRFGSIKVTKNAVPAFFDWNQDKYLDMIIGNEEGTLQLVLSPGKTSDEIPNWIEVENALLSFNVYALSHPLITDFDADGAPDLLIGNDDGDFLLFLNKGKETVEEQTVAEVDNSIDQQSGSLVVEEVEGRVDVEVEIEERETEEVEEDIEFIAFSEEQQQGKIEIDPIYIRVRSPLIRNERITRSTPAFGDLDHDGDYDLLIGSHNGELFYYENQGDEIKWNFKEKTNKFVDTSGLKNTAPMLFDYDQDGDFDLVIGSKNGRLRLYTNQGTSEETKFIISEDYLQNVWLGKNAIPSSVDIDNDGFTDILAGTFLGKLVQLKNDSSDFLVVRRDYQDIDVDIGSAPFFADLNNSGQIDMIVGSDAGRIFFFRNESIDLLGNWVAIPKYAKGLTFPRGTSPAVIDLDNDGDPDLITGSEDGPVLLYRNDAVIREIEVQPDDESISEEL